MTNVAITVLENLIVLLTFEKMIHGQIDHDTHTIVRPEIDQYKYSELIFKKGSRSTLWSKDSFSRKW
jgi:hypothetical protein